MNNPNDRTALYRLLLLALVMPLLLAARVSAQQPAARRVAVATRAIARGAVLSADDFIYRDTTLRAPLDTNQVAAGWVTRRSIMAGEVLRTPAVEPPNVINANTPVQVEYNDGGVRLTIRGTATKAGALGERVTVRTELGNRIEATVVAPGRVRID
jgi:flagella basal body P-ring formation protein FlgA